MRQAKESRQKSGPIAKLLTIRFGIEKSIEPHEFATTEHALAADAVHYVSYLR